MTVPAPTRSTVEALRRGYDGRPPRRAFTGSTVEEFAVWRRACAARLRRIYRLRREPAGGAVRRVDSTPRDGYREDRLVLSAPDDVELPAYLLVPTGRASGPFPAVVFLHGHGASAEHVLGRVAPEPGASENTLAYLRSLRWVERAPRAGYLCLVPEHRGFGALAEEKPGCQHAFLNALALGRTLQGMRVADLVLWLDHLAARPDVRLGRIAVGGISLGGELSVLLALFDERVGAAISAGFVRDWRDQIAATSFCPCSYAPGLLAELDAPELAGLIAPRPLLVQSGDRDPLYPRACAEAGIARAGAIYAAAGGRLDVSFFPGRHEFDGPGALAWLQELWA
ncbi:MAG TPA: alpha/beta hydrolase family protein [Chloroflexota bacterium]|nr:alpha/beta hydrolase family protein [Chloroflexota bacterium]